MLRRDFLRSGLALGGLATLAGCKGNQYARIIKPGDQQMVGSHQAGQEAFRPMIDEAVGTPGQGATGAVLVLILMVILLLPMLYYVRTTARATEERE